MRSFFLIAASTLLSAVSPAFAEDKAPTPRSVDVAVGRTVVVQMTSKRPIKSVINDNAAVVRVSPFPDDPTKVLLTGLAIGRAHLILTDIDGKEESRDLGKPSGK